MNTDATDHHGLSKKTRVNPYLSVPSVSDRFSCGRNRAVINTLVIGVDSSTTGCKAIAWDRLGRAVAEGRASYPLLQPKPRWYEQDAEQWWHGTCAALRELLDQVSASQVEALCITHQRESFVPVDREGRPLRHAILWLDERSRAQVAFLEQAIGREQFHQVTGKPLTTNPSLPKIVWLMQHEPAVVERTFQFLDTHAFLVHRLTGHFRTSLASADPMGLVDMQAHTWSADLLRRLPQVPPLRVEQFPDLVPPGTIIGHVSDAAAAATGLTAGLPVVAGAGDGQCAGLGANATGGGRASLNMGTAVVSGAVSGRYLTDLGVGYSDGERNCIVAAGHYKARACFAHYRAARPDARLHQLPQFSVLLAVIGIVQAPGVSTERAPSLLTWFAVRGSYRKQQAATLPEPELDQQPGGHK